MTARHRTALATQDGMSLIELMISLAIGVFVIGGALTLHSTTHAAHQVGDTIAQLQENGRYGLDLIESDLRLAGFWVDTNDAAAIRGRAGDTVTPFPAASVPPVDCYPGFFNNLLVHLESADDAQVGAASPFANCIPDDVREPDTDIVVIRRAASAPTDPAALTAGRIYLVSNRIGGALMIGGQALPAGFTVADPIHELLVRAYYIHRNSDAGAGIPSLRRIRLADGPVLIDEELVPGIEDLQIQFGIDADADDGLERYVQPGGALVAGERILAARIWLRVRAERPEVGYTDDAAYEYAEIQAAPGGSTRRMVTSGTVVLRNSVVIL